MKCYWIGDDYKKEGIVGNDVYKINVLDICVVFCYEILVEELSIICIVVCV